VGKPPPAASEVGVELSNAVVFFVVFACACAVALVLARALSARLLQSRQERLKAHLDWVNPTPQTSRKRKLSR
jgi:hypothetical protein